VKKRKKVFVALSGGVDSAVSAFLLKKHGFDVSAGFIRGYNVDGCQDKDQKDAASVAAHLDIPFYVFDMEGEYKKRVVDYMLDGYRKGITPNPDVVCNSQIKFGLFYDRARKAGADFVASGHYAINKIKNSLCERSPVGRQILNFKFKNKIYQAKDLSKDQTYFLWQIPFERFEHVLFPLGKLLKTQVRAIAKSTHLPVADKKDSQGVCFLGKFNFDEFLREHITSQKGDIIDTSDKKVGEHDGVWFYTIGQGHGFLNTAGRKFYVTSKDVLENILRVAYEGDKILLSKTIHLGDLNFLDMDFKDAFDKGVPLSVFVRTRYRQSLRRAQVLLRDGGAVVTFDVADSIFSASGQSVVFYSKKGQMLGGGIIA